MIDLMIDNMKAKCKDLDNLKMFEAGFSSAWGLYQAEKPEGFVLSSCHLNPNHRAIWRAWKELLDLLSNWLGASL